MNRKFLWAVWGGLFALSAACGFVSAPEGLVKALLVLLALCFFVPGFLLLRCGSRKTALLVRNLAIASLSVSLVMIVVNILSLSYPTAVGNALYGILVVVSAPMVCSRYWAVSLFLWAVLMICAAKAAKKR